MQVKVSRLTVLNENKLVAVWKRLLIYYKLRFINNMAGTEKEYNIMCEKALNNFFGENNLKAQVRDETKKSIIKSMTAEIMSSKMEPVNAQTIGMALKNKFPNFEKGNNKPAIYEYKSFEKSCVNSITKIATRLKVFKENDLNESQTRLANESLNNNRSFTPELVAKHASKYYDLHEEGLTNNIKKSIDKKRYEHKSEKEHGWAKASMAMDMDFNQLSSNQKTVGLEYMFSCRSKGDGYSGKANFPDNVNSKEVADAILSIKGDSKANAKIVKDQGVGAQEAEDKLFNRISDKILEMRQQKLVTPRPQAQSNKLKM